MKAYFLPLGERADQSLPAVLTAFSCGAVRETARISMLQVSPSAPDPLAESLMADLNACHRFFAGKDAFAFFRTDWSVSRWQPALPDRAGLVRGEAGPLLLSALRGEKAPLSFRADWEAVEWSISALLADAEEGADDPFLRLLRQIREDLAAGEEVRVLLFGDLTDAYAAGMALGLLRFLRRAFGDDAPWIGLIGQVRALGAGAWEQLASVRDFLSALRERNLVRLSDERDTQGADAFWLLGLPASLMASPENARVLDWAAARIMGDVFGDARRPSPGLHTRELPGVLTLQSLDQEAKPLAAFLRGALWCLSDLFPALHGFFDHPTLLRSLAPATRNGLFRRLFRDSREPTELALLERALRAMLLEGLTLLRGLPVSLREAEPSTDLWQQAVRACGRCVTLGAEYDVRRKEAEESGVDRVAPVHRVSMADTEEEELLRKLDDMAGELGQLEADRAEIFRKMGGFGARQAVEDCLSRCRVAEVSAREKLSLLPAGEAEERYALGLQERRVRTLAAAVRRCERDLAELTRWEALRQPGAMAPSAPFAGEILDPELAAQAFQLLTAQGETADAAARTLRDGLGGLLKEDPTNDVKTLLKNLLSVCRQPDPDAPLRSLMAGVFSVCGVEVAGHRFQSAGELPAVPLLPDMREEGRFFTLTAAPERLLAPSPRDRTAETRGLLAFLLLREYRRRAGGEAELCLIPFEKTDSALSQVYLEARGAERAALVCLRQEALPESRPLPLAVLLPGVGLEPARLTGADPALFPDFCLWLDRESLCFRDPCPFLGEGDREILTQQLTRLRASMRAPAARPFLDLLSDWHRDIIQAPRSAGEDSALRQRLRVVCGLYRLPIWRKDLQRVSAFYEPALPGDPVCAAIAGTESFDPAVSAVREDILYAFRGTPIARESAARLLESTHLPEEAHLLASLGAECDILLHSSDDYHEALAEGLQQLLARFPGADPAARAEAESLLSEAREPVSEAVTELTWPWDTVSASVLTILTECLGAELAAAALRPFSEKLALYPARGGEILGDHLLSSLCRLDRQRAEAARAEAGEDASADVPGPEIPSDAVLPPLSPDFARVLCRRPEGQRLLQPGFLSFALTKEGIRAALTLEGAFTLKLIRVYPPEEQLSLYAHDMPTLAVWPSLPFAPGAWQAYFSFAHAPADFGFTLLSRTEEAPLEGVSPRFAARTEGYPLGFLLTYQGAAIGAVPNLLPAPELPEAPGWTACLDFGASAASVVMESREGRWPLQGPVRMRTLLRNPAATEEVLARDFLPAVPVSALLPGALRIFRNSLSEADTPLRDAAILMSPSLRDVLSVPSQALYADLKWNGEKGRAARLYLHQVMLMAALEARCGGAASLGWKAALPDEMAAEGRERLADTLRSLAAEVAAESGLPLPEKAPPVLFASESAALGHYFRFCAPEETRGGFMALDLGADTADLSLFLRGRDQAVRACQLPLGVHYMLLPTLLRQPGLLMEDFGFLENESDSQPAFTPVGADPALGAGPEEIRAAALAPLPEGQPLPMAVPSPEVQALLRDLRGLQALLEKAARDPAALRHARYGLDALLADHLPLLLDALARRRAAGRPGRTGALLLLHFSFLMMLSGLTLLQISADAQKNDFLPESMTLFLAGRGAVLVEGLSLPAKTSLWKMLTMFRNPRVASLNLLFSAEKKMEIPVGLSVMRDAAAALPRPAPAPVSMALRPEELLPEFLLRFRREFPAEAGLLFPGVFGGDLYTPFTPYGQQLLLQAIQTVFGGRESGRPYPALIDVLTHMLDMIREGTVF